MCSMQGAVVLPFSPPPQLHPPEGETRQTMKSASYFSSNAFQSQSYGTNSDWTCQTCGPGLAVRKMKDRRAVEVWKLYSVTFKTLNFSTRQWRYCKWEVFNSLDLLQDGLVRWYGIHHNVRNKWLNQCVLFDCNMGTIWNFFSLNDIPRVPLQF